MGQFVVRSWVFMVFLKLKWDKHLREMLCSFSFVIHLFIQAGWLLSLMWHVPPNLMFGSHFNHLLTSSLFLFFLVTLIYYLRSLKGHFEKISTWSTEWGIWLGKLWCLLRNGCTWRFDWNHDFWSQDFCFLRLFTLVQPDNFGSLVNEWTYRTFSFYVPHFCLLY